MGIVLLGFVVWLLWALGFVWVVWVGDLWVVGVAEWCGCFMAWLCAVLGFNV